MPITKLFPGRAPIREVVAEIVPQNGAAPDRVMLEAVAGPTDDVPVEELGGLTAEVERLELARREAEAVEAQARARAEAARAELEREEARLAELKGEAARLEEVLRAQAHEQVVRQVRQEAAPETARAVVTVAAEPEPQVDEARAPETPTQDASAELTCRVEFWRGYRKAAFYARTLDGSEEVAVAESPLFRARGNGVPDRTDEAAAAYAALVERLQDDGWRRVATGSAWFDATFARAR